MKREEFETLIKELKKKDLSRERIYELKDTFKNGTKEINSMRYLFHRILDCDFSASIAYDYGKKNLKKSYLEMKDAIATNLNKLFRCKTKTLDIMIENYQAITGVEGENFVLEDDEDLHIGFNKTEVNEIRNSIFTLLEALS